MFKDYYHENNNNIVSEPTDALADTRARPSAGTKLTTKSDRIYSPVSLFHKSMIAYICMPACIYTYIYTYQELFKIYLKHIMALENLRELVLQPQPVWAAPSSYPAQCWPSITSIQGQNQPIMACLYKVVATLYMTSFYRKHELYSHFYNFLTLWWQI